VQQPPYNSVILGIAASEEKSKKLCIPIIIKGKPLVSNTTAKMVKMNL